jgi:glycosyltransferase involved in cell wall biosynthesis
MSDRSGALAGAKIVVLIGSFARGGAERQAYLLARELRQTHAMNVEVWAISHAAAYGQNDGDDYANVFRSAGVPVRVLGFSPPDYYGLRLRQLPVLIRRLWRVVRQLREAQVDILLPFTTWPNVLAGLTYRLAGVKLCVWGERHCGIERVRGLEPIAVRQYRHFVANSTAGIEFLAGDLHVPRQRLSHVPNGVEDVPVDGSLDWKARLGLSPTRPLVVMVANLSIHKDQPTLLRAWKIVQDRWQGRDRPYLALAGYRGVRFEECQKLVREAAMDNTVALLGSIDDVPGLIAAADLTVFSSLLEGMPNGVLECMAAGKAVVATDLPGVLDALGPNANGVVVPKGDAAKMAVVLLDLLQDRKKRDAIGERNRQRILSQFSVARMAENYLRVVEANLPKRFARSAVLRAVPMPHAAAPLSSVVVATGEKDN